MGSVAVAYGLLLMQFGKSLAHRSECTPILNVKPDSQNRDRA